MNSSAACLGTFTFRRLRGGGRLERMQVVINSGCASPVTPLTCLTGTYRPPYRLLLSCWSLTPGIGTIWHQISTAGACGLISTTIDFIRTGPRQTLSIESLRPVTFSQPAGCRDSSEGNYRLRSQYGIGGTTDIGPGINGPTVTQYRDFGRRASSRTLPRSPPPSHSSPPASARWVCSAGAGSGRTLLLSHA